MAIDGESYLLRSERGDLYVLREKLNEVRFEDNC
jgi:hypothetical protein